MGEGLITTSAQYAGLFGYIGENGTVKNVVLEGVKITSDKSLGYVGGVAGYSYGKIENCSVSGSVSGSGSSSDVGGVVGYQVDGSITGCSSSATVKGTERAGGIAGSTNGGASLTGCYATGSVSVENNTTNAAWAGGVVGVTNSGTTTLTACYATGDVTVENNGNACAGGVVGYNNGTVTACYHASGNVSGTSNVGGVVGRNTSGTVTACYWSGLPDNDNGGATKVDGTTVTWQNAVDAMNSALGSAGSQWLYSSTGTLPSLTTNP